MGLVQPRQKTLLWKVFHRRPVLVTKDIRFNQTISLAYIYIYVCVCVQTEDFLSHWIAALALGGAFLPPTTQAFLNENFMWVCEIHVLHVLHVFLYDIVNVHAIFYLSCIIFSSLLVSLGRVARRVQSISSC